MYRAEPGSALARAVPASSARPSSLRDWSLRHAPRAFGCVVGICCPSKGVQPGAGFDWRRHGSTQTSSRRRIRNPLDHRPDVWFQGRRNPELQRLATHFLICSGKASVEDFGSGLFFQVEWPCVVGDQSKCSSVGYGIVSKGDKTWSTRRRSPAAEMALRSWSSARGNDPPGFSSGNLPARLATTTMSLSVERSLSRSAATQVTGWLAKNRFGAKQIKTST